MVTRHLLLLLIPWVAFCGCTHPEGEPRQAVNPQVPSVSVEQLPYKGWPSAWRLRSATCEMIIVPAVSRVMHLSLIGQPNLLWEDPALSGKTFATDDATWHNIGGEKLWPTQQKDLFKKYTGHDGWPPPWPWDSGPSRAEPIPHGLRLTLPYDSRFGARAIREFTLDANEPRVHVRQWIEKIDGPPAQMTVWTVCQVRDPELSLLPSADGHYVDFDTHSELMQSHPGYVTLGRDPGKGLKIGVPATVQNGWVASVFATGPSGHTLLLQSHKLSKNLKYPDEGLQAELYTAPHSFALYTEMELLSPLVLLKAGERLEDDAIWQLLPVSNGHVAATAESAHQHALDLLGR
jgi:hypothetical protein